MANDNYDRIRDCIVRVLSVEEDKVKPEASFSDDLDADSLDLVELVMEIEEEFGVSVEEEELENITTVGAVVEMLKSKLG